MSINIYPNRWAVRNRHWQLRGRTLWQQWHVRWPGEQFQVWLSGRLHWTQLFCECLNLLLADTSEQSSLAVKSDVICSPLFWVYSFGPFQCLLHYPCLLLSFSCIYHATRTSLFTQSSFRLNPMALYWRYKEHTVHWPQIHIHLSSITRILLCCTIWL